MVAVPEVTKRKLKTFYITGACVVAVASWFVFFGPLPFNSQAWKAGRSIRDRMSWQIRDKMVKGKSTEEVLKLLGEPDQKGADCWTYYMGNDDRFPDEKIFWLGIDESGKVKSINEDRAD